MATAACTTTATALGPDLLSVVARLNRMATRHADLTIPYAQARLLAQVDERGSSRISTLAAADHCSQPTMTAQIQRLEAAGLVVRRPDPGDARAVLVTATPTGMAALTSARESRAAVLAPHLAELDAGEVQTLTDAVGILRRILDETSPASDLTEPGVIP